VPDISPDSLYYFCSPSTALEALSQSKLPWSQLPNRSGLDLSCETPLGFDIETLQRSSIKLAISLIFGREEPKGETPLIAAVRRWRGEQRFSTAEEAEPVLNELLGKMVDHRQGEIEKLMQEWRSYSRDSRFCSLFEKPDAQELWHHRAQACTGLAFKFTPSEDSHFEDLHPVQYGTDKPEITTLKDQMGTLFYNIRDKSKDQFQQKSLQRSTIFKAEKEWRKFQSADEQEDGLAFETRELKAIYLGPCITTDARQSIMELVQAQWPNIRLYQAQFSKAKFSIVFDAIGEN
jgi:hypothetical protein